MPGENLTRVEADERAALLRVNHYDVNVDLTTSEETFRTVTTVTFAATTPGAETFIDAITTAVHRITLNGADLDPATHADGTRITLPNLQAENTLEIDAEMRYMNTGEGLHRFVDPADGEVYLYSQFEVPDARRMYPNFEQPNLKATFAFTVVAPKHWTVLSNQPLTEKTEQGDAATWKFDTTTRMSTYITALVAGPYSQWTDELQSADGRRIPLGVFCRASLAEHMDADYIFDITKRGFEFYEREFGVPYPFAKYDQIFVPEYNAGAMENVGCVTFTETYIFRSKVTDAMRERRVVTILHELGHMWFGDLVTMNWWNDLWLNESFAEFISTLATAEATEWENDWVTFLASEKTWAYRQDQLPSTHPIVAEIRDLDDVQVNFDGITYAKGASVLKQLFFWVGREAFFTGIHAYFTKHAFKNTELHDLLKELEDASGRNLRDWSAAWLETAGVNTLHPHVEVDAEGIITRLTIGQTAPSEYPTLRPHRLGVGLYDLDDAGRLVRRQRVELDVAGAETEVTELVGEPRGDLVLLNDGDLAYAKIRFDEVSRQTALAHAADIDDPLARALVLASLWDATRDAELPAPQFIDHVLRALAAETESTTRRQQLAQLGTAARRFTPPEQREATVTAVADALWGLTQDAAPGSDAQFALVRAYAEFATTPEQVDRVQGLFDGTLTLEGLTIDTDLGWELLTALAAAGRVGEQEIAARLATDTTNNGNKHAATARAALPTRAAKQAAWQLVWSNDGAPNDIVRSTILGFWRVHDPGLVAGFVEPYFAELDEIWRSRSFHIAEALIEGFYPTTEPSPALEAAAASWLTDHPEAAAPLRRMIVEGLDDTRRCLRVQQVS